MQLRAVLLAGLVAGCSRAAPQVLSRDGFIGTELTTPVPKPPYVFTDSRGEPFRFDSATAGKVTLLLFGYTNCPDICPVHLANLAAVLDNMPEEIQRQVQVVFVTTDPRRDSLPVLHAWVTGFDAGFIGLRAPDSVVAASLRAVRLPPVDSEPGVGRSAYSVGHGAAVIAYTRDGEGRVEYPSGTRQKDWAHDLPLLVNFGGTANGK